MKLHAYIRDGIGNLVEVTDPQKDPNATFNTRATCLLVAAQRFGENAAYDHTMPSLTN